MMKAMLGTLILFMTFSQSVLSAEFSAIQISGWKKEELSHDHLRFSNPTEPDHVIHLQVESYDPKNHWNQKTLKDDVRKMEKIRNDMSFFAGMKDYKITSATFDGKVLELEGSYIRLGNKNVRFKEMNFYGKENFLQFKLISESGLPSVEELKKILGDIKPDKVEID